MDPYQLLDPNFSGSVGIKVAILKAVKLLLHLLRSSWIALRQFLALVLILGTTLIYTPAITAEKPTCNDLLTDPSAFRLTRPGDTSLTTLGKKLVEHMIGLSKLLKIYETNRAQITSPEKFWSVLLDALHIQLDVKGDLSQIPPKGRPLVIVANHPYGFLDGIALSHLVSSQRDDYMVLGNALLAEIPDIRERIIPVHILSGSKAEKREKFLLNRNAIQRATEHVKAGGALITFPSGVVATSNGLRADSPTVEAEWQTSVAKIILESGASTLPVRFEGKNSVLFHLVSRLNLSVREILRVALLPRELLNKSGKTVPILIGKEQPFIKLLSQAEASKLEKSKALTEILKNQVQTLAAQESISETDSSNSDRDLQPIANELSKFQRVKILNTSVANGSFQVLKEKEAFTAYKVKGADLDPNLLHHLGVLREKTFREVGEGSGLPSDTDQFDLAYDHLLIWSKEENDIVGAYRLGSFEEARRTKDFSKMYTHSQFNYQPSFFQFFDGGMLEMGRSFVVSKYQNDESAPVLQLLWGAIGEYLYQNESYRYMCGPVSLSGTYSDLSKTLIKAYFMNHHGDSLGLKAHLKPEILFPNEVPLSNGALTQVLNQYDRMSKFDGLIESLEGKGKGIPPLVKHYPGLMGAKFIEASFDPSFNTLDFLICVDLKDLDERKAAYFVGDKAKAKALANRFK